MRELESFINKNVKAIFIKNLSVYENLNEYGYFSLKIVYSEDSKIKVAENFYIDNLGEFYLFLVEKLNLVLLTPQFMKEVSNAAFTKIKVFVNISELTNLNFDLNLDLINPKSYIFKIYLNDKEIFKDIPNRAIIYSNTEKIEKINYYFSLFKSYHSKILEYRADGDYKFVNFYKLLSKKVSEYLPDDLRLACELSDDLRY